MMGCLQKNHACDIIYAYPIECKPTLKKKPQARNRRHTTPSVAAGTPTTPSAVGADFKVTLPFFPTIGIPFSDFINFAAPEGIKSGTAPQGAEKGKP